MAYDIQVFLFIAEKILAVWAQALLGLGSYLRVDDESAVSLSPDCDVETFTNVFKNEKITSIAMLLMLV